MSVVTVGLGNTNKDTVYVEHPKAKAARLENEAKAKQRESDLAAIKGAISLGFNFLLIGDTTVCYTTAGDHVIHLSTAVKNSKDAFDKVAGRITALQRMREGQGVTIKRQKYFPFRDTPMPAPVQIKRMFEA